MQKSELQLEWHAWGRGQPSSENARDSLVYCFGPDVRRGGRCDRRKGAERAEHFARSSVGTADKRLSCRDSDEDLASNRGMNWAFYKGLRDEHRHIAHVVPQRSRHAKVDIAPPFDDGSTRWRVRPHREDHTW